MAGVLVSDLGQHRANLSSGILACCSRSSVDSFRLCCQLVSHGSVDVMGERRFVELVRGVGGIDRGNLGHHAARVRAHPLGTPAIKRQQADARDVRRRTRVMDGVLH